MIPISILLVWASFHLLYLLRRINRCVLHFSRKTAVGVRIKGDSIEFRIPVERSRWNPLLKMHIVETPLNEISVTTFNDERRASLLIKTPQETICIPSGTFAIGGYSLEQQLRGHCPGIQPSVSDTVIWRASPKTRIALLAIGSVIFAATATLIVIGITLRLVFLFLSVFGLGPIFLSMLYGGKIVVDSRGIFYERSGKLIFISWKSFACIKVSDDLGIINTKIKGKHKQTISFSNMLGMGFSHHEIQETIEKIMKTTSSCIVVESMKEIINFANKGLILLFTSTEKGRLMEFEGLVMPVVEPLAHLAGATILWGYVGGNSDLAEYLKNRGLRKNACILLKNGEVLKHSKLPLLPVTTVHGAYIKAAKEVLQGYC